MDTNQTIHLPWGAWFGDRDLKLSVPDTWHITNYTLRRTSKISAEAIQKKIKAISGLLSEKKPKTIIIVVDDLTRPVVLSELMDVLLQEIHQTGITAEQIKILIGLGSHEGLNEESMIKKLGFQAVNSYTCLNHDPKDTVPIDVIWGRTPVKLNRHYVEAEFKIVISGLTPHSFAGFSGGAKMLFPGLADMETIAKTHKSVLMGFMGKLGDMSQNKFRDTIEKFVDKAGLDFFIGAVINGDRSLHDLFCGDYVKAHRQAAERARAIYLTDVSDAGPYDLLILNAYPKDTELLQAENGFIPLKSAKQPILKEGGMVLLTSACSDGLGHHGLFGPGGLLYRKPRPLRFLKNYRFVFLGENVSDNAFHQVFAEEYPIFGRGDQLTDYLRSELPPHARVAVFPTASLQLTA